MRCFGSICRNSPPDQPSPYWAECIWTRHLPPGRKSAARLTTRKPSGPHQRRMWSWSSHMRQTRFSGALKLRVISSSSSRKVSVVPAGAIVVPFLQLLEVGAHLVEAAFPEHAVAAQPAVHFLEGGRL